MEDTSDKIHAPYGTFNGGKQIAPIIGAEGQVYLNDLTLYLQGGAALLPKPDPSFNGGPFFPNDFGFIRGVARYFLTDNLRVQAELSYARGSINGYQRTDLDAPLVEGTADANIYSWGLRADYRPDGAAATLFAAYEGSYEQQSYDGTDEHVTDNRFLLGAKIHFGSDTLRNEDREGVTFDVPKFTNLLSNGRFSSFCLADCTL